MDGWHLLTLFSTAIGVIGIVWRINDWRVKTPKIDVTAQLAYNNFRPVFLVLTAKHRKGTPVQLIRSGIETSEGKLLDYPILDAYPCTLNPGACFSRNVPINFMKALNMTPMRRIFFVAEYNDKNSRRFYRKRISKKSK